MTRGLTAGELIEVLKTFDPETPMGQLGGEENDLVFHIFGAELHPVIHRNYRNRNFYLVKDPTNILSGDKDLGLQLILR